MYEIYAGDELLYSDIYPNHSRKVASPTLKMAVDEAGSLEFTVSEVNKCYTKLEKMKTIITVKKKGVAIWDGRILQENRDLNKNKKMYVEGAFAFLNDSVQPLKEYANVTFQSLIESILSIHNDIVKDSARYLYYGGITDEFNPVEVEYWITAYESTIDVIKKLVEYFECHYVVKKNPTNGHNELFFFKDYYRYSNQTVVFSKNLMDYTDNYDLSKMATVLIPLCKTSRESTDVPLSIGTTIDLTEELPYDPDTGYGVLCARTTGWAQTVNTPPDSCVCSDMFVHFSGLSGAAQTGTGLFRWSVLNLRQYVTEDESVHVKPYAFTVYPMTYYTNLEPGLTKYPAELGQIFTGDFDIWPSTNTEASANPTYDATPDSHPENFTIGDFDFGPLRSSDAAFWNVNGDVNLDTLQKLNYGAFKCIAFHDNKRETISCAVIELDTEKYKSFYLSDVLPDLYPQSILGGKQGGVMITVWKIKDDNTLDDWIWLDGRDAYSTDPDLGVMYEYNPMGRAKVPSLEGAIWGHRGFRITAGRVRNGDNWEYNADRNFKILNPNKYEFLKVIDDGLLRCYEKEIKLNYTPETGYSSRVLIGLYGTTKNLSIILPSDDTYSVLSIGESSDGIKISEENPARHDDQGNWEEAKQNDVYDETKGYGTIVPPSGSPDDHGARLPYEQEYVSMASPFPNIQPKGGYYLSKDHLSSAFTSTNPGNDIIITDNVSEDYKCTALIFKPSYVENGVTHKKSVFISTSMYGRTGMYAIFELSSSTGAHENWYDGTWIPKCRVIEYGKYINGMTEYNQKKITLPVCNDKDTLLLMIVCSYQSEPNIWVHDPAISEKVSYLTIAAANNGDIRLYAEDENVFTEAIESGAILDQNGSPDPMNTTTRCRTKDFIKIHTSGTYALAFEHAGSDILARAFLYDTDEGLIRRTDFKSPGSDFYIDGLEPDVYVKFEFKRANETDIDPTAIQYPQFYRLNSEMESIARFEQGPLVYGIPPQGTTNEIYADTTDANAAYFLSSQDYMYSESANDVIFIVNMSNIPRTVVVDDVEREIVDRVCYLKVAYQTPTDVVVDNEHKTIYDNIYYSSEVFDVLKWHFNEKNIRYKIQIRMDVFYMDGDVRRSVRYPLSSTDLQYVGRYTSAVRDYSPPNLAYETYGHIERRVEFDDMESSQELLDRAKKYMNQSQFDAMTIKAKALDMSIYGGEIDDIYYGDKTLVSSPPHGVYKYFIVKSQSIPFDNVANTTFEFGFDNKDTLSKLLRKEKSKW